MKNVKMKMFMLFAIIFIAISFGIGLQTHKCLGWYIFLLILTPLAGFIGIILANSLAKNETKVKEKD